MKFLDLMFIVGVGIAIVGAIVRKDYVLAWTIINAILLFTITKQLEKK
jgi:hypothetical protein